MKTVLSILRPALIALLTSKAAKELLVEIVRRLAEESDNKVDDTLVEGLARALEVKAND